jgi:hypothetical protein
LQAIPAIRGFIGKKEGILDLGIIPWFKMAIRILMVMKY